MPHQLPASVRVTDLAEGRRWVLPWRTRRQARAGLPRGVRLDLGGLGCLAGMTAYAALWVGLHGVGPVGLPCLGVLSAALVGNLATLWYSRSRAEVRPGLLRLTERAGWFWWTLERPLARVRKLVLHELTGPAAPEALGVIEIQCTGAQNLWFAAGYPYELLTPLVIDLAAACRVVPEGAAPDPGIAARLPPAFPDPVADANTVDQDNRPPGNDWPVVPRADGCAVYVPPSRSGDFVPRLVTVGVLGLIALGLLSIPLRGVIRADPSVPDDPLVLWLALWADAGVLVPGYGLWWLYHFRRRRVVLTATGRHLTALWAGGLWPPRVRTWPRDEVTALRVGGLENRDLHLYLRRRPDRPVRLLRGYDTHDLRWLATVLRRTLRVPAASEPARTP